MLVEDGFYAEASKSEKDLGANDSHEQGDEQDTASATTTTTNGQQAPAIDGVPKGKQRVLKKIPQKVIENAVGLAIFTTMRTGLWLSGAGGSGVLVARKADGSWSPPSGILLHTAGLGFLVGVDIYDCVVVINNRKALAAFTAVRATLGGEISAVAGPVGMGGVLENDGKWKEANRPVFTYLKSRGFYAGVQVDGTIIIERTDENARFYDQPEIKVADILEGKVRRPLPQGIETLMETLKAAEGRTDVDGALLDELDELPPPGDVELEPPGDGHIFGIPEKDDPDPYGVHALEAVGLEIHEAGTGSRPSSEVFNYKPSPSSPVFGLHSRSSIDGENFKSHHRSLLSEDGSRSRSGSQGRPRGYSDAGTQTENSQTATTTTTVNNRASVSSVSPSPFDENSFSPDAREMQQLPDLGFEGSSPDSWTGDRAKAEGNVWEDAREELSHTPRVKAMPPPLPPRGAQKNRAEEFEEVDLHGLTLNGDKQ